MYNYQPLTWQGQEMTRDHDGFMVWVETDNPQGGDRVSMGTLGMNYADYGETVTHYLVPCTTWGDYCGDCCQRSNYRSLIRDYPETFVEVLGGYNSQYLAIPKDNLTDDLDEIFTNLAERYPLYDESDHSELEMDEAYDQWNSWARDDILCTLSRDYDIDTDDIDSAVLMDRFFTFLSEGNEYPYLEDAVTIVYPGMDDFTKMIAIEKGWTE